MQATRARKIITGRKLLFIALMAIFAVILAFKALLLYVTFTIYSDPITIALGGKVHIESIDIDRHFNMTIVPSASFPEGTTRELYEQVHEQIYGSSSVAASP